MRILEAQTKKIKFADDVDLMDLCTNSIPQNFTGADFSALTSECYMIAVKEKIKNVQVEIAEWKKENTDIVSIDEELLPETYIKLRYPDNEEE